MPDRRRPSESFKELEPREKPRRSSRRPLLAFDMTFLAGLAHAKSFSAIVTTAAVFALLHHFHGQGVVHIRTALFLLKNLIVAVGALVARG